MSRISKAALVIFGAWLAAVSLGAQPPWLAPAFQPFVYGMTQPIINCSLGTIYVRTSNASPSIWLCAPTNTWTQVAFAAGTLPAGSIVFVEAGSCPTGYVEVVGLNEKTIIGTLAANGNVGTTGGANTVTPTVSVQETRVAGGFNAVTAISPFDNRSAFVRLIGCKKT